MIPCCNLQAIVKNFQHSQGYTRDQKHMCKCLDELTDATDVSKHAHASVQN